MSVQLWVSESGVLLCLDFQKIFCCFYGFFWFLLLPLFRCRVLV